jgi:hypothetical protein
MGGDRVAIEHDLIGPFSCPSQCPKLVIEWFTSLSEVCQSLCEVTTSRQDGSFLPTHAARALMI